VTLISLLLFGCGGDDASDETSSTSATSTSTSTSTTEVEPPKPEPLNDFGKDFIKALDSGECKQINALNPSTRPALSTKARCESLELFKDFEIAKSEDYGDGAVIDLIDKDDREVSAIFTRETDGTLSLVLIDNLRSGGSVGTKLAKEFDDAAAEAATALREKDCDAFIDASYVRRGFAVGERQAVCDRLETFPVADLASRLPDEPPELVGGNSEFAFYALGVGEPRVVLIMAHQTPLSELGETEVPEGGSEYGLLDVYPILAPE